MHKKLLVVDDHDLVRGLIAEILSNAGFDVIEADCGRAAIDIVSTEGEQIACVLQDMSMPEMSGPETIQRLKALRPDLRILVLSVDEEPVVRHELGDLDVYGFLEKPCDSDRLLETVRAATS